MASLEIEIFTWIGSEFRFDQKFLKIRENGWERKLENLYVHFSSLFLTNNF